MASYPDRLKTPSVHPATHSYLTISSCTARLLVWLTRFYVTVENVVTSRLLAVVIFTYLFKSPTRHSVPDPNRETS